MRCTARSYSRRYLGLLRCRFGRRGRHRARGASSRPPRVITSRRSARPAAAGAGGRAGSTGCTRLPLSILRAHEGDAPVRPAPGTLTARRPPPRLTPTHPVPSSQRAETSPWREDLRSLWRGESLMLPIPPKGAASPWSSRPRTARHRRAPRGAPAGARPKADRWERPVGGGRLSREHAVSARPATDRREDSQAARGDAVVGLARSSS